MAKKRNGGISSGNILFGAESDPHGTADTPMGNQKENQDEGNFLSGFGRGERIAAFGVCLLLAVGAFGASGFGEKIASMFNLRNSGQKTNQSAPAGQDAGNNSLFSALNPFAAAVMTTPTPQLSKEYIYSGSRMLAVEDAAASAVPPSDLAVWRPSSGYWYVLGGTGSQQTSTQWGQSGDVPVPGDYDGDGKTDFAVFRNPDWHITLSSSGAYSGLQLGNSGDTPVTADYDGDGKTDIAVYQNGSWAIRNSSTAGSVSASFGQSGDTPVPADFDGDGKADLAVWRVTSGQGYFYYLRSTMPGAAALNQQMGQTGDLPVVGDFDGDGKSDVAVYREATAGSNWFVSYSGQSFSSYTTFSFGQTGDKLVSNDYDGDGKLDVAVWRPANGTWYIRNSSDTTTRTVQWGQSGDTPVPAFYRR